MDATRLPPPAAAAPASGPDTTLRDNPKPIAGRFLVAGPETETPTGGVAPASDTQQGGATVWIKLVPPAVLPTLPMADRALRELKQLAKVSSERVVRVLDQGRTDDGRVYVATEAVAGTPLDQLIAHGGPLSVERAAAIVLQIGEALTEAQKVGVIHRNVSPRNVFVGAGDAVKVGDFGLAEPITDKVFGTPAYLSPEQVEGRPVDQRSNIYSLGAIFYFALTGEPPFTGEPQSLLQQQLSGVPQPPSTKRAGLAAELDKVILKALEKSGGRRHLTLRQLLTEVEAASGVKASDARPVAPPLPVAPAVRQPAGTVMGLPPVQPIVSPKAEPQARTMMVQTEAPKPPPVAAPPPPVAAAPIPIPDTPRPAPAPAPLPVAPVAPPPTVHAEAPRPVAPSPVQAAAQAGNKKGGFRETAWFKQGELEEELAKAAAAQATADPLQATGTTGKHATVDAGDLTAQDRQRLSLKTGSTQAMPVVKGNASGGVKALPGDRMDEAEMLAEIDSSKKWFLIAGLIVGVVVVAVVLWLTVFKSAPKAEAPPPEKPTAVAAAPPTAEKPPVPAAPAVAPKPPAATPAQLISDSSAELRKDNLPAAVELFEKAGEAGADGKELKKLESAIGKALSARLQRAKRHKEKSLEAETKALMARLHAQKKK